MKTLFWLGSLITFYIFWTAMGFDFQEAVVAYCTGSLVGVLIASIK